MALDRPASAMRVSPRTMLHGMRIWARALKRDVHAIYLAANRPDVPWHAKIFAAAVAGYALSPIDLIPDFIPVLGYVDDLIIVPLGIWLVVSLIPKDVMAECRAIASEAEPHPRGKRAAVAIVAIWIFAAAMLGWAGFAHWFCPLTSIEPAQRPLSLFAARIKSAGLSGLFGSADVGLRYLRLGLILVSVRQSAVHREEIRDGLEDSKDRRSAGRHGDQYVRLRGAQIALRQLRIFNGGGSQS
jgi:uncharacterized membrane protein YkvA (DUF1232 family)